MIDLGHCLNSMGGYFMAWQDEGIYTYSADNVMHVFPNCINTMHWTNFYLCAMDVEFLAIT